MTISTREISTAAARFRRVRARGGGDVDLGVLQLEQDTWHVAVEACARLASCMHRRRGRDALMA
jgi:hypothetical protein